MAFCVKHLVYNFFQSVSLKRVASRRRGVHTSGNPLIFYDLLQLRFNMLNRGKMGLRRSATLYEGRRLVASCRKGVHIASEESRRQSRRVAVAANRSCEIGFRCPWHAYWQFVTLSYKGRFFGKQIFGISYPFTLHENKIVSKQTSF